MAIFALIVSNGGNFISSTDVDVVTAVVSSPMAIRPQDEVETMDELDDTNSSMIPSVIDCGAVAIPAMDSKDFSEKNPRHLSILSGSSTSSPAQSLLSRRPHMTNAFSAQSSASLGEKHTPKVLKSEMLDAEFFNDGATQTGGALIRPFPVGVSLSGAGISFPHTTAFRMGIGEMVLVGALETFIDVLSFIGPNFFDSSSDIGMVIGINDLTFASRML